MSNLINVFNKAIKYIEEKIKNSEEIIRVDLYVSVSLLLIFL